jgi:hypothetical protein
MKPKIKIGMMALETVATAVIALILLWILSAIITAITPSFGSWAAILMMFAAAIMLLVAIYLRPGNENFVETVPIIIITLALLGSVKTWIPQLPALEISFSWTSLAWGLSAIYFADILVKKTINYIW